MKKLVIKWVAGETAMPVLAESYKSFKKFFDTINDINTSYYIFYNGGNFNTFKNDNANLLYDAAFIDQREYNTTIFPLPLQGCLWKEFPKIKMFPDAYEIYVDCDIILINCKEILSWIYSPLKTLLLYKNDSDKKGYYKGPVDAKPYVDSIRYKDEIDQLNADLCAGFYGSPPEIEINIAFNETLEILKKDNPLWSSTCAKGYGSDQGIFCFFAARIANNLTIPFYLLSYERHPFYSVTKDWITKWVDLNNVEFIHVTGATNDWREDRKTDHTLFNYLIHKIKTNTLTNKLARQRFTIKNITIDTLNRLHAKGRITLYPHNKFSAFISLPLQLLFKLLKFSFPARNLINRILNKKEIGQYESGLYMDIFTEDNTLLFTISIDIKNEMFNFNPRIYYDSEIKIVFRENEKILLTQNIK